MYRLYNRFSGEHLYTTDAHEVSVLTRGDWWDEGIGWISPVKSQIPVYRLYNRFSGEHHYTIDVHEVQVLSTRHHWTKEGIAWYSSPDKEVPVYRQYNPGLRIGQHHYTTDTNEYKVNNSHHGWRGEGIAWHALTVGKPKAHPTYQNPSWMYQISTTQVKPRYPDKGAFSYVSPNKLKKGATRKAVVEAFIQRAVEYIGTKYVWDYALAPGQGVDCSGLVLQAMYAIGINPSRYNPYDHYHTPGHDHYANDMRNDTRIMKVAYGQRQRGDLVFYDGHVAIYIGNDRVIDAQSDGGVKIRSINALGSKVLAIGRLIY